MATAKTGNGTTHTKRSLAEQQAADAKDGWADMSRWDFDGFWQPSPGARCEGEVVDVRAIQDRKKRTKLVYVVRVVTACAIIRNGSEEQAEPGDVIGVGESAGLRNLRDIVSRVDRVLIRLTAQEKKDIGNGQTMWVIQVLAKGGIPRKHSLDLDRLLAGARFARGADEPTDGNADAEVPF